MAVNRDMLFGVCKQGIPDFPSPLDFCDDAGIGLDAAIDRISYHLADGYLPPLRNFALVPLQMRTGK
jgi:hypothetical protein